MTITELELAEYRIPTLAELDDALRAHPKDRPVAEAASQAQPWLVALDETAVARQTLAAELADLTSQEPELLSRPDQDLVALSEAWSRLRRRIEELRGRDAMLAARHTYLLEGCAVALAAFWSALEAIAAAARAKAAERAHSTYVEAERELRESVHRAAWAAPGGPASASADSLVDQDLFAAYLTARALAHAGHALAPITPTQYVRDLAHGSGL